MSNTSPNVPSSSSSSSSPSSRLSRGFRSIRRAKSGGTNFVDLLERVADVDPEMRIRFTSAHPKDFPDDLFDLIRERPNVCRQIHLPAQSGNTEVRRCP